MNILKMDKEADAAIKQMQANNRKSTVWRKAFRAADYVVSGIFGACLIYMSDTSMPAILALVLEIAAMLSFAVIASWRWLSHEEKNMVDKIDACIMMIISALLIIYIPFHAKAMI